MGGGKCSHCNSQADGTGRPPPGDDSSGRVETWTMNTMICASLFFRNGAKDKSSLIQLSNACLT